MSDSLEVLSNDVLFGMMSESPDIAVALGVCEVAGRALPQGNLPDFSEEGTHRRRRMVEGWSQRLARVPAGGAHADDDLTRQSLRFIFERGFQNRFSGSAGFDYADHLDPVTHITGVHSVAIELLGRDHPLASLEDARCYVERLAKLPQALADAQSSLEERRARGFVAPRIVLKRAIDDICGCMAAEGSAQLFFTRLRAALQSVARNDAAPLLERAMSIIESELRPAYASLVDELEAHVAVGRESIGSGGRPGGDAFYAWRFAGHTTSSLTPEKAHAIGREELKRLHAELGALFSELNYTGSLAEAFAQLAAADAFPPGGCGRQEILAVTRSTVLAAKQMMRPLFNLWPTADVTVEAIAPEHEQSMHSTYVPPHPASGKGGIFWINLQQSASQPRGELAVVTFHETWPGHHLQLTLAQEAAPSPLRRALLFNAYLEGWAKYAEALPTSFGLVDETLARVAALRSELYSTATLVLDTGVHVHGWSFDEAVRFFSEQTGGNPKLAQMVAYRSIAEPAQLASYKIGLLTVRKLKADFERTRGSAFRIQDFHDAFLSSGALPLDVLERSLSGGRSGTVDAVNPSS